MSLEDSIFSRGDGLFSIVPVDGPDDPEVQAVQCTAAARRTAAAWQLMYRTARQQLQSRHL